MSIRDDNILSDAEHLYAEDLGGRDVTLTIAKIEKEEVKGGGGSGRADKRYTFHFRETPKKYVPGIGVRRAICAALGTTNRQKMIGVAVILYPTTCEAFGSKNTPCIRFRGLGKQAIATLAPPTESATTDATNGTVDDGPTESATSDATNGTFDDGPTDADVEAVM